MAALASRYAWKLPVLSAETLRGLRAGSCGDSGQSSESAEKAQINHGTSIRPQSLGIHPGPSYEPAGNNAVSFYTKMFHRGAQLVLTPGTYPDLDHPYNFGSMIESIKFHQGIAPAPRVSHIPLVVELHEHNYVSSG